MKLSQKKMIVKKTPPMSKPMAKVEIKIQKYKNLIKVMQKEV